MPRGRGRPGFRARRRGPSEGPDYESAVYVLEVSGPPLVTSRRQAGYFGRQDAHHRDKTFQEEFIEFLTRMGVQYDERHIWR